MPQLDPQDQPAPADPAANATPPVAEPSDQQVPAPNGADSGNGDQPTPAENPGDQGTPTPSDDGGQQPQPESRQERRDRESAMRKLNQERGQAADPNQFPGGNSTSPQFPTYREGDVVSPERLQQDVVQTASAIANLQVKQQLELRDATHQFERDQESLPTKFAELNPDPNNDLYTPELDEAIAQEYRERAFKVVGYRPDGSPIHQLDTSVRLSTIAERQVNAARAYAKRTNANMNNAVDANADDAAPRPTGDKPSEVPFENLSRDEMRKRLGYHNQR